MAFSSSKQPLSFVIAQLVAAVVYISISVAFYNFGRIQNALGFYGVYHRDPLNQLIHFFGVPLIIWSIMVILAMLPIVPNNNGKFKYNSWATVYCLTYALAYLKMDLVGGLFYAPVILLYYFTSLRWVHHDQQKAQQALKKKDIPWYGTGDLIKRALLAHVFAWYIQIHIGHKILEGAQPAVLASLGGALSSAPLFAFYEGLWYVGIQKELQQETLARVAELTAKICQEGGEAAMRVCETLQ